MCDPSRCSSLKMAQSEPKYFGELLMKCNKVSCFLISVFNYTLIESEVKYMEDAK
jgi:hypothetical protein